MQGFLNLEGEDFAAFVIAALAGFLAGNFFSNPDWAAYASILVSYHLFLAWLVFHQSGRAGLSMPVWMTVLTHAACMVVALGPVAVSGHRSIGFGLFRYGIAGLAIFETGWVFSKEEHKPLIDEGDAPVPLASDIRSTAEDEAAWLEHFRHRRPGMTKPGVTIRQERDAWMRARIRTRAASAAKPEAEEAAEAPAYLAS